MKKLLCFLLCMILTVSGAAVASMSAVAADTDKAYLTVTTDGKNPVQVPVGSELLLFTGVYAGDVPILDGQGQVEFDPEYVSLISYGPVNKKGKVDMGAYSFPEKIANASLVCNIQHPGFLHYNFSRSDGICTLDDPSVMFSRFRFKAEKAGTTDITNLLRYMMNEDGVRVFHKGVAIASIGGYTQSHIEAAICLTGDVDNDYEVTIVDATCIQRIAAGNDIDYLLKAADVNGDGIASLRDALQIRQYLAGDGASSSVNEWLFPSEI